MSYLKGYTTTELIITSIMIALGIGYSRFIISTLDNFWVQLFGWIYLFVTFFLLIILNGIREDLMKNVEEKTR